MPNISVGCNSCDESVRIPQEDAAINIYEDNSHELRFTCPLCNIVKLVPIPQSQQFIFDLRISEKHHIIPYIEQPQGTPISEVEAISFDKQLEHTKRPLDELRADIKQLHRDQRNRRIANIFRSFGESMLKNQH